MNRPYELHNDRELEFMLSRGKPLAHFYDYSHLNPARRLSRGSPSHLMWSQGSSKSRIVELLEPDQRIPQVRGVYHVLYAQAEEAWRIDAYIAMRLESDRSGWSERFERLRATSLDTPTSKMIYISSNCLRAQWLSVGHGSEGWRLGGRKVRALLTNRWSGRVRIECQAVHRRLRSASTVRPHLVGVVTWVVGAEHDKALFLALGSTAEARLYARR